MTCEYFKEDSDYDRCSGEHSISTECYKKPEWPKWTDCNGDISKCERTPEFQKLKTAREMKIDEILHLIECGIEYCPNRSHCLHILFLASTPEGRIELFQQQIGELKHNEEHFDKLDSF